MILDNKKGTYKIWLQKFVVTIAMFPLIIVAAFSDFFNVPFLGIDRVYWIILFSLIYISVIIYHRVRNPYYVYYSDNGKKITLRFYPVRAFNQKKNSIVFLKSKFVRFEVLGKGMNENLVLYSIFKNRIGKYPPIPMNLVSNADRKRIYNSLNQYVKKSNKKSRF